MDSHPHLTVPARAQLGDLAGFGRVYRDTYGLVRGVVRRLGVADAALEDATQDVFIVAYRRRAEFDGERPIEPWLAGIARRVAFRYRRSAARGQRKLAALAHVDEAPREQLAAHLDARRFLGQFLEQLRDERREVFVLGELYGLTGPEIAARLQIPVDTAYTRLRAGRRQLEQALLRDAADEPAPSGATVHRGWLLILPRLGESSASGWLALAIGKYKLLLGTAVVVTIATVPIVASPPEPPAPSAARSQAAREPVAPSSSATGVAAPPPPPNSRLEALLAAPPEPRATRPASAKPEADPLGAARLAAALARLQAGDAAGALAEVDRHARDFADSPLAEARGLTRVRALCQLGRVDEARAEADRLDRLGPAGEALAATCAAR